ncbi:carbohydrate ABC transporter permease [Paenibacillaceae bacterium]|nr:carbohydrate ABC transporter permease [Paenibacillaceae bacterium]
MKRGQKKIHPLTIFNYVILGIVSLGSLLPLVHVVSQSLSSTAAINSGKVLLFPVEFTLVNYDYVLQEASLWRAFGISVFITVVGTLINLIMTSTLAYPLSRPEYRGRKLVLVMVLVTLIFQAPLIPTYLLVRELHLIDTLWALMLPGAISAFNLFVMRSFFISIPSEIIESARMDGSNEARTLWQIIVPLSKPAMATMGIFYAVTHWNNYSNALYFINKRALYPLQVKLRELIITDDASISSSAENVLSMSPEGIKMAVIIIATLPIVMVYPFLQKYFIKGMLIGSIKS